MGKRSWSGFSICFRRIEPGNTESLGLTEIAEGNGTVVDIVAIHGLNGHSEKTWTARNGVNWLRKFLPIDLPNARIFTYGYDARTHASTPLSEETFRDYGEELVRVLYEKRNDTNTNERPIIFIAHSLGGLVVKGALVESNSCNASYNPEHRSIMLSTYGILFMGTPHQGGNGVRLASFFLKFAQLVIWTNDDLLKSLAPGSTWLKELEKDYKKVIDHRKFVTKMCYEDRHTEIIPRVVALLVVRKESAVASKSKAKESPEKVRMYAGHRDLVRYRSQDDVNYQKVIYHLGKMIETASETIKQRWQEEHQRNQIGCQGWSVNFSTRNLPREKAFVGRKEEMRQIHQKLQAKDEQSIVVLHGLSGMGKTQLAVAYAYEHKNSYDAVFWLNSNNVDTLKRSFVDVAHRISKKHPEFFPGFLHLVKEYERRKPAKDVEGSEGIEEGTEGAEQGTEGIEGSQDIDEVSGQVVEIRDKAVEEVNTFLSQKGNTKWLLIFDNYNTPNVGAGRKDPAAFSIEAFLPDACHGNIIVTSTSSELSIGGSIPVKKLQHEEDCLLILSNNSGRLNLEQEDPGAKELVKKLDGLPLAFAIAGAYIRQTTMSFSEYLKHYNERWAKVQEYAPTLKHYDQTLLTTWNVSLDQVRKVNPDSEKLLLLWAYFDNRDIWWEMLKAGRDDKQPMWFRTITEGELEFGNAMRPLCQYNLAEPNPPPSPEGKNDQAPSRPKNESYGYSMHPCVHEWTRNGLSKDERIVGEDERIQMAKLAFSCLAKHMPRRRVPQSWILQQRLSRHVDECLQIIQEIARKSNDAALADTTLADSMHEIGCFYYEQDKLDDAEELFKRALVIREKELGDDNEATLRTVNNLGVVYLHRARPASTKELDAAEEMLDRALAGKEKILGPNDECTLRTCSSLASLYQKQGRLPEAKRMIKRALKGYQETLGEDYYSTASAACRLASIYTQEKQKLSKAADLYHRAWRGYEKCIGMDHPWTLSCARDLGDVYRKERKFDEAMRFYHLALQGYEKTRGVKASCTLGVVHDIAFTYQQWGRLDEAEESFRRALQGFEEVLGPGHTTTVDVVFNLGKLLSQQGKQLGVERQYRNGKFTEALEMYQRAREGYERHLGPDDISTLNATFDLGLLLSQQGQQFGVERQYRDRKLTEALEMYEIALKGYRRTGGRDSESALNVLKSMGDTYMLLDGMLGKAEDSFKEALEGYERTCGHDMELALFAMGKLGETYMLRKELSKAQEQLEKALEGYQRNESVLASWWIAVRLWDVHSQQGNLEAAKSYADQVPGVMLVGFGENGTPSPPVQLLLCDKPWDQ